MHHRLRPFTLAKTDRLYLSEDYNETEKRYFDKSKKLENIKIKKLV